MAYDTTLQRLPDPYTTPKGPGFISVSLTDNSPGTIHDLNTGGTIGVKFAGNYWTMSIGLPELFPEEADTIYPFLSAVSGGFENFYVQLPQYRNPKTGAWSVSNNTLIAKGSISIGPTADSIRIPSWSTRGGNYSVGDMLKFDNSNKIYQVRSTSLVSNTMTIRLNCPILQPTLIAGAGFEPNDIKFRVRMLGSVSPQLTARGLYEAVTINLRENIL